MTKESESIMTMKQLRKLQSILRRHQVLFDTVCDLLEATLREEPTERGIAAQTIVTLIAEDQKDILKLVRRQLRLAETADPDPTVEPESSAALPPKG